MYCVKTSFPNQTKNTIGLLNGKDHIEGRNAIITFGLKLIFKIYVIITVVQI